MARKREITKIESFLSIRTLVRTVCDECQTDEDALAYVEEGLVKINGQVVMDPYYGTNGDFHVQIAEGQNERFSFQVNRSGRWIVAIKVLVFANKKENLQRLREGEILHWERTTKKYGTEGCYISLPPPEFSGDTLIACHYGKTRKTRGVSPNIPHQAVTECGARL